MQQSLLPDRNVILFIDDEKPCHNLLDMIISSSTKYQLVSAFNGHEGLKLAKEYADRLCLILCDIMLVDVDGYDLYDRINKEINPVHIPYVFQSGLTNQESRIKLLCDHNPGVSIIYKPYNKNNLLQIINRYALKIAKL